MARSNASRHGPPLRRASSPLGQLLATPSAPRPLALSRRAPCASSRHDHSLAMLSLAMIGSCYPWVHDCLCLIYIFVFTTVFVLLLYINPPVLARFSNQSTSPLASVPVLVSKKLRSEVLPRLRSSLSPPVISLSSRAVR